MTLEAPRIHPVTDKQGIVTKPWRAWLKSIIIDGVFGGGTTNKVSKWSSANTLTDAIITDDGSTITLPNGTGINEFSIDGTMAGESDDVVPTEQAVVEYIRSKNIQWDNIVPTFNANNQVTQRLYKRATVTKVTEVLAYDAYRNISTRTFTGELAEIWTYTYTLTNGERIVTDITKT